MRSLPHERNGSALKRLCVVRLMRKSPSTYLCGDYLACSVTYDIYCSGKVELAV
jgi:hypothetical protein